MSQIATKFLTRCFSPEETIAVLLRSENPVAIKQRIVRTEQVLQKRYQAWLSYENSAKANLYVGANPLHPGSRRRTKQNIVSVRHLYLDIDVDGEARLRSVLASEFVPTPNAILSTSPGKYQALWRVEGFDFVQQEQALKVLSILFGGDPACTDRNRVIRIPGFLNWKYDPPFRVSVEYPDDSVWTPEHFRLTSEEIIAKPFDKRYRTPRQPSKQSLSEDDWTWVSGELVRGTDPTELTRTLASIRPDKPNPLYYAQRTVDIASARLSLVNGSRFDAVVSMLERRRRFEIPAALCSARAREIAATAERMITRKISA